jgi:tRNA (adenine57-N1/adenine58-N1)-methyltransferase
MSEPARGAFRVGDLVQLTDPKGRLNTISLTADGAFHGHRGSIPHSDVIGQPEGVVVTSTGGTPYLALRPLLLDFVLGMPRGAAVIYPKDAARIVSLTGLQPGDRVVEAGAGSGALTCHLVNAVGPDGRVHSFERRDDFAAVATKNVGRWFGGPPAQWTLTHGDLQDGDLEAGAYDAVVLDMLAPWECLDVVEGALRPGGTLVAYVATTTQLSRIAETLRARGCWTEPRAEESMVRTWHLEGLAVRPDHRMIAHTGFLLSSRRLAPGTVLPARRTRPAKGAYGEDWAGVATE